MRKRLIPLFVILVIGTLALASREVRAACTSFVPANPNETDSGVLIDNFKVTINGTAVNSNDNFELGNLTGFNSTGDVQIIECLGDIKASDGSRFFALLTTGPKAEKRWYRDQESELWQKFNAPNSVTSATVSFNWAFVTNEDVMGTKGKPVRGDWMGVQVCGLCHESSPEMVADLLYGDTFGLTFANTPAGTGFGSWTGWQSFSHDLTAMLKEAISNGITSFILHTNVEEYTGPTLDLQANQGVFHKGEQLSVTAKVTNESEPASADVKLYAWLPGMFAPFSILNLPGVPISPWANFTTEVFRYTFNGSEPPGPYSIEGSFHETITGWELWWSSVGFEFSNVASPSAPTPPKGSHRSQRSPRRSHRSYKR